MCVCVCVCVCVRKRERERERNEGNVLFNDALNTYYLRLYGVGHMVKGHSDYERRVLKHGSIFKYILYLVRYFHIIIIVVVEAHS